MTFKRESLTQLKAKLEYFESLIADAQKIINNPNVSEFEKNCKNDKIRHFRKESRKIELIIEALS